MTDCSQPQLNEKSEPLERSPTASAHLWGSVVEQLLPKTAEAEPASSRQQTPSQPAHTPVMDARAHVAPGMPADTLASTTIGTGLMNGVASTHGPAQDTYHAATSASVAGNSSGSDDDLPLAMRFSAVDSPSRLPVTDDMIGMEPDRSAGFSAGNTIHAMQGSAQSSHPGSPTVSTTPSAPGINLPDSAAARMHRQAEVQPPGVRIVTQEHSVHSPRHSPSQSSVEAAADLKSRNVKRALPKVKRSERCGHCHTCQNRQLKQACITVRAKQAAEATAQVAPEGSSATYTTSSVASAPAHKRPRTEEASAHPFFSALEAVIGSNHEGGLESLTKVSAMLSLMASQTEEAQKMLLVEVVQLSSSAVKSVLASGRAVELLGSWLLEAATGGQSALAAAIMTCLQSLPIGMSALRTAKIGKTMSRVKKTAATELHGPAAALIDKWRSAVGTASNADSVVSVSRASDGEPPGKRLKASGKVSMVDDDEMFRTVVAPLPRPPSVTVRRVHEQAGGSRGAFDPRAEAAAPGAAMAPHKAPSAANGDAQPDHQPDDEQTTGILEGDAVERHSGETASDALAVEEASDPPQLPPAPVQLPIPMAKQQQQQAPLPRQSAVPSPVGATTRIGGLGSGLGSGIGSLMATSAASRWGDGAAGRAAEAASRIPSPPPVARNPSRRRITWRAGADIVAIRIFRKDDAPIAVATDAEIVPLESSEAVPAVAPSSHPPGFETAARQEHLSEAAALKGHQMAEQQDPSEVSEQQAFSERYQAMAPTMPWISPPPVPTANLWAAGEDSIEVSNENLRQSVVRPVNFAGTRAHVREPPVHEPEKVAGTPLIIPLMPMIVETAPEAASGPEVLPNAAQLHQQQQQQQSQPQQGVPYNAPPAAQLGQQQQQLKQPQQQQQQQPQQQQQQQHNQWQSPQYQQPIPPQSQWQFSQQQQQQQQMIGQQGPIRQGAGAAPRPTGPAFMVQQTSLQHLAGRNPRPQLDQPGQAAAVIGLDPQQQQQLWQQQQQYPASASGKFPPSARPPPMTGGLPPPPPQQQQQQHFQSQQRNIAMNSGGAGRSPGERFSDGSSETAPYIGNVHAPRPPTFPGGALSSLPTPFPNMPPNMLNTPQNTGMVRGPPPQSSHPGPPRPPGQTSFLGPPPASGQLGMQQPLQQQQLQPQQLPQQQQQQQPQQQQQQQQQQHEANGSAVPGGSRSNWFEGDSIASPQHEPGGARGGHHSRRSGRREELRSPPHSRSRGSGRGTLDDRDDRGDPDGDQQSYSSGGRTGPFNPGRGRGRGGRGDFEGRGRGRGAGVGIDPDSKRRICLFYNQAVGCRKGDTCSFAHVRTQIDEGTAAAEFERISGKRGTRDFR